MFELVNTYYQLVSIISLKVKWDVLFCVSPNIFQFSEIQKNFQTDIYIIKYEVQT